MTDYARCPDCGCISWPPHPVTHRPRCTYIDTDPAEWSTT